MILKLVLLSGAFYMGVGILMEAGLFLWARVAGSAAFFASRAVWFALFGTIWFGSFSLAWHIVWTGLQNRLHQ